MEAASAHRISGLVRRGSSYPATARLARYAVRGPVDAHSASRRAFINIKCLTAQKPKSRIGRYSIRQIWRYVLQIPEHRHLALKLRLSATEVGFSRRELAECWGLGTQGLGARLTQDGWEDRLRRQRELSAPNTARPPRAAHEPRWRGRQQWPGERALKPWPAERVPYVAASWA